MRPRGAIAFKCHEGTRLVGCGVVVGWVIICFSCPLFSFFFRRVILGSFVGLFVCVCFQLGDTAGIYVQVAW